MKGNLGVNWEGWSNEFLNHFKALQEWGRSGI